MGTNPNFYATHSELTIRLSNAVLAKLSTFRRQERPEMTDEEAAAFVVEEYLIGLGLLALHEEDRGKT